MLRVCAFIFALLACATVVHAVPLDNYRERVHLATVSLNSLQSADDAYDDEVVRAAAILAAVQEVRKLLPAREQVEWEGTTIEVDNSWLHEALNELEGLDASNERRMGLLKRITERLDALDEQLNAQAAGVNSSQKDEEKARLTTILRRDEYVKKAAEKSALARLWERFINWLNGLMPKPKRVSGPRGPAGGIAEFIITIVVFVLIVGLLAFLVWKLVPRFIARRRGSKKSGKREARIVLGERLEPDQTSADLLDEAEALAREGRLREAIRKGYIALLCELGDRKVLRLAQHKTIRDYLQAVRDRQALYAPMRTLTTSFENHWYGYQPATENDWTDFRSRYRQTLQQG